MNDWAETKTEERRLRILQAIALDEDQSMSQARIKYQFDAWAYKVPIELVRQELRYLARMGAIRIVEAGDEFVAVMKELGRQHLAHEIIVEGVQIPKRSD